MECSDQPVAGLTLLVACIAAWVAYRQYRTEKNKLRLELFDRRWAVFQATMEIVETVVRDATVEIGDVFQFGIATNQAEFLFDTPVVEYLGSIREKAIKVRYTHERLSNAELPPDERHRIVEENSVLLTWFTNQINEARVVFRRHLGFGNIF